MAGALSFAKNLRVNAHAAWLAARDPRTPWHARAFGLVIAAYALSPIDLVPDFIPVIGLLDDAILIPLGIWAFVKLLPPGLFDEHRAVAAEAATRPVSIGGGAVVALVWVLAALGTAHLIGFRFS